MDLNDILCDFNCDHNWFETRDQIAAGVQHYNEAIAAGDEDPGAVLYGCLPVYWQIVRQHNIHRWGGVSRLPSNSQYNVGIFLVGFSSLPIVLSIAEIQPRQQIYFLHSPETRHKCDEIKNRITEMLADPSPPFEPLIGYPDATALINRVQDAERCEIANPSDPVETFKQIKGIIDLVCGDLGHNTNIALDLTGGKKTMIGGGFTAGSIYSLSPKCDMFYVDSSEYDPERGAPTPSTEFLSQLDNPYDVYNVQNVQKAEALFNEHNYEAALHLWRDVKEKLDEYADRYSLQNERDVVEKNLHMADCYSLWNAFDYKTAFDESARPNGHLWGYNNGHITDKIDVLDILQAVKDQETLFACETRIMHWAVDRYQNASRCQNSDRFDDAIVRFTQVVEILCIYHVYRIQESGGLLAGEARTPVSQEDVLNEHWSITKLIHFLFTKFGKYDYRRYEIALHDRLLNIDDYGYKSINDIINLIKPRNVFVHVTGTPAWEDQQRNAEYLQELALKFLENLSCPYRATIGGLSLDDLLKLHEFRQL